jgi:hypothetical protein
MRVNTDRYLFSHGKNPRGTGAWLFEVGDQAFPARGTYSKAKQEAIKFARTRKGVTEIIVLP